MYYRIQYAAGRPIYENILITLALSLKSLRAAAAAAAAAAEYNTAVLIII